MSTSDKLKENSHRLIDREHGKVETNPLESGYQHVWNHGIKGHCMSANHMKMCVTQGYLNSNQTAMSEVMGPDYSWRLDVFKRLRMPVGPVVQEAERKRVAERERTRKRKEDDRKVGKKAHGKYEAHHRQQQRKRNSVIMKESRGMQKLSLRHNGKSKSKKVIEDDIIDADYDDDRVDEDIPTPIVLLVVLDINETLLYRKYLPSTRGYTTPVVRPYVTDFIHRLLDLLRREGIIHLAVWCGAWTHTRENKLLSLLEEHFGLVTKSYGRGSSRSEKNVDLHLRSLPGCKTRNTFKNNPGKFIVIKPIKYLKTLCPHYEHVVLFDNNIEKCLGFSQKPDCRLANKPNEYIIVKSFRGDLRDNELQYGVGTGCLRLFMHKYIDEFKNKFHINTSSIGSVCIR